MIVPETQDKVTIQEAVNILSIGRRTIYRWIDKGLLSKYKEDGRTFVLLSDVRALCAKGTAQDGTDNVPGHNQGTDKSTIDDTHYTVNKEHYEGLLIRLGQLEAKQQLLLEYKGGLEAKDKELAETKVSLDTQTQELAEVKSALATNTEELEKAKDTIAKARNELQRLLEVKKDAEAKGKALVDQQTKIEQLETEVKRLKRPWWKRIFLK